MTQSRGASLLGTVQVSTERTWVGGEGKREQWPSGPVFKDVKDSRKAKKGRAGTRLL